MKNPPPFTHTVYIESVGKSLHLIQYNHGETPTTPPKKIREPQDNREHCITQVYFVSQGSLPTFGLAEC